MHPHFLVNLLPSKLRGCKPPSRVIRRKAWRVFQNSRLLCKHQLDLLELHLWIGHLWFLGVYGQDAQIRQYAHSSVGVVKNTEDPSGSKGTGSVMWIVTVFAIEPGCDVGERP